MSVQEVIQQNDITDAGILRHGFTDTMRDYEIVAEMWRAGRTDDEGPTLAETWTCRFVRMC